MHQCSHQIRIKGMNFFRTRQCKHSAIESINGKWFCHAHVPARMRQVAEQMNKDHQKKLELKFKIKIALKAHNQKRNNHGEEHRCR